MSIRYHRFNTKDAASSAIATELACTIVEDPTRRIGLATGNSVIPIYAALITRLRAAGISLKDLVTFNLDEWGFAGQKRLSQRDIRTFAGFMNKHLFDALAEMGFDPSNAHFPSHQIPLMNNLAKGVSLHGYDELIEQHGGIHTWLVGIGAGSEQHPNDGHVAFIEREHLLELGDAWVHWRTYTDMLDPQTIINNAGYEGCDGDSNKVPNLAITVGPGTLIGQIKKRLIMAAFSPAKAGALRGACELKPYPGCSASVVQILAERGITVDIYMDQAASSQLQCTERFVS